MARQEFVLIYALLILIALATRNIGDFRPEQYIIAEAVIFGWLWLRQESWLAEPRRLNRFLLWISMVLAAAVYLRSDVHIKLAILFGTVLLLRRGEDGKRRALADWALPALAIYAVVWAVLFDWPATFNIFRKFSFWYSDVFSALSPPHLRLGPTPAGWAIILSGIVFTVVLQYRSVKARWANTASAIVLSLIGQFIFWAAAYPLAAKVARWVPVTKAVFIHLSLFYLVWVLAVTWMITWIHPPHVAATHRGGRAWSWKRQGMLLGAVALCLILFGGPFTRNGSPGKRVLILNADKLDSMIPNYRRFGDKSAGMFGMLPRFCRGLGYDIRLANVTPEIFDSIDVVIFANLLDSLPRWQRDSLVAFVHRGGGLLALADHTGYTAIRGPTNDITEPMGLSVNFDTAVPLRRSWVGQMRYLPQRVTQSATTHADLEVWLGGSVEPAIGAMPVVIGTQAYSDPGDTANAQRSYLGNLAYDSGEPLGDIVLVGTANYGRGRVALFTDTSPFQNGALVKSHRLAARTLGWLSGGGIPLWDQVRTWGLPLLLIAGTVLAFLVAGGQILGLAYLVLLPVVSISLWNLYPAGEPKRWVNAEMNLAFIDGSHSEIFDLMGWEKYSIGGLELNLMRNGYSPELRARWEPGQFEKARLILITRPSQPITRSEIKDLEGFIDKGGWVLLTAGWEEQDAVHEFLARYGLRIENIPLGRAEGQGLNEKPKFARAYQISGTDPQTQVLCTASKLPVAMAVRRGKGGLVFIGDPVFLFNDNLENRDEDYHIENIRFLHQVMIATAGSWGQVEEVRR